MYFVVDKFVTITHVLVNDPAMRICGVWRFNDKTIKNVEFSRLIYKSKNMSKNEKSDDRSIWSKKP